MVIIVGKHGQLCNRLFHASAFLANAIEHDYRVYNTRFNEYFADFEENYLENRKKSPMRIVFQKNNFVHTACRRALGLLMRICVKFKIKRLGFIEIEEIFALNPPNFYDLNHPDFVKKAQTKIVLVAGFCFRDAINFEKYQDQIRAYWRPNAAIISATETAINRYRKDFDIIIGVHVRRGDYADYQGGKWFFGNAVYEDKMLSIKQLEMFKHKKLLFVICSNESVSISSSSAISVVSEPRNFMEDLHLLSLCDYIVGVPSTFSMWASFYGQRPLLQIRDSEQPIRFEDFKIVTDLDDRIPV
jgi:Glycosyl transferase family 11